MAPRAPVMIAKWIKYRIINTERQDWLRGYDAAARYREREGDLEVRFERLEGAYPLGRWLSDQRRALRAGRIPSKLADNLEALGVVWDTADAQFAENLAGGAPASSSPTTADAPRRSRWETPAVTTLDDTTRTSLLRRGFALEYATLGWNVIGIVVLAIAAVSARSVALAGFGLDSLIEIGASTVVIWELSGTGEDRQRRALRMIGFAFAALAVYLLVQSTLVLVTAYHPGHSALGIAWTAITAAAMFTLAHGKTRTGAALDNPVLRTEGRVTLIDGILASAVLLGLTLNATLGWWWADPAAGYVLVYYAVRECREIFTGDH
ncbi:Helicase associated domain protein [Streptomyces sp. HUAS TT7]|uniref:Helicase associated domain protein n=1 Tax=Streptomyces sp. HUAS TT7 TaxID=3447507 RepID=UPI003F65F0FF